MYMWSRQQSDWSMEGSIHRQMFPDPSGWCDLQHCSRHSQGSGRLKTSTSTHLRQVTKFSWGSVDHASTKHHHG
jgi:hypothetical protein